MRRALLVSVLSAVVSSQGLAQMPSDEPSEDPSGVPSAAPSAEPTDDGPEEVPCTQPSPPPELVECDETQLGRPLTTLSIIEAYIDANLTFQGAMWACADKAQARAIAECQKSNTAQRKYGVCWASLRTTNTVLTRRPVQPPYWLCQMTAKFVCVSL